MAKKKEETFALVRGEGWFIVDREAGSPRDGKPWFIGVGAGFDILRLLVYADNETDAEEIMLIRDLDNGPSLPKFNG